MIRALLFALVLASVLVAVPAQPASADTPTGRDLQECPEFPSATEGVELSLDEPVLETQQRLVRQGFSDTSSAAAWALRSDPLTDRLVQAPPPNIAGLSYESAAIGGLPEEVRALVADHGTTATRWRLVATSEADAEVIRDAVEADPLAEVVVHPRRRELVEVWSQLRTRTRGWRDGTGQLTPGHWRTRSLPPVDSPPWGVVSLSEGELDRDISWLVENLSLDLICRVETPTTPPPVPDAVAEGPGWRIIARPAYDGSAPGFFDSAPEDERWGPDTVVDFDTEFVVELDVNLRMVLDVETTFDGLNISTGSQVGVGHRVALAVDRSLLDGGLVVRIDNIVEATFAGDPADDGRIVRVDALAPEQRGLLAPPPEPHAAPLVAGVDTVARPGGGTWRIDLGGALYATDGAPYLGSMGGIEIDLPMVAMAPTDSGDGYWMVARDGGVFTFGDAGFLGSVPGVLPVGARLASPIVGIEPTESGAGYWLVAADGGVFTFGDAIFHGSVPGLGIDLTDDPVVGIAASQGGYWVATASGRVFGFGSTPDVAAPDNAVVDDASVSDIVASPDGMGFRLERGTRYGLPYGSENNRPEPALEMLRCPEGETPRTLPARNPISDVYDPLPTDLAGALRNSPDLSDGHWVNRGELATDVIGHRQVRFVQSVWIDSEAGQIRGGWRVATITTCVPIGT